MRSKKECRKPANGVGLMITGADLAAISRKVGHAIVQITTSIYTHCFAKRNDSGLGAKLEAMLANDSGPDLASARKGEI